jgi:DNA (cytosine-5)-methyltransferase 1
MTIRTLDLFSGGGGSSYGARAAGAEIVCGVDAWACATTAYAANFRGARPINLLLDENSSPSDLGDIGRIDLLLASPECTSHTCARGSRPPDEESKRTAHYVLAFAAELKPRWVVVENVIHMRGWQGYAPLLDALGRQGYKVQTEVLDASRFGVPQIRKRLFILADRERMPRRIPRKRGRPPSARGILDPEGTWASTPLRSERRAQATIDRADRAIATLGVQKPFLIVYYGSDGAGGWQPLNRPLRTVTTLDRFGLVTWQGETPMLRMLQVPELARAMGFGDDYVLDSVKQRRDRIRILGNGVPPPVMQAIVEALTVDP